MNNLKGILNDVYEAAVKKGYKVFTFEKKLGSKEIEQIFITDGERIGTCSLNYGMASFGTVHIPTSGIGTGFESDSFTSIEDGIEKSMMFAPKWAKPSDIAKVKKYKSAEEYFNKETILNYYYL